MDNEMELQGQGNSQGFQVEREIMETRMRDSLASREGVAEDIVQDGDDPPAPRSANNPGQTLQSINFNHLIGSPLVAAVNASAQAAMATAAFIETIGFKPAAGPVEKAELRTVTFEYKKLVDKNGASQVVTHSLTVPLLTILPIPYLRVDSMTIDFRVKIDNMFMVTNSNKVFTTNQVTGSTGYLSFFNGVNFNCSVAASNENTAAYQQSTSHNLNVVVHAGVDAMPRGMEKVLDYFSEVIQPLQATT